MSGPDVVKRTDFMGYPTSTPGRQPQNQTLTRDYLGDPIHSSHLRGESVDTSAQPDEEHDLSYLSTSDSRARLNEPPSATSQNFRLPPGASSYNPDNYLPAPAASLAPPESSRANSATTPNSFSDNHVHYPPSPQIARVDASQGRNTGGYTTIPLNDPPAASPSRGQSPGNTPSGSGANTPNHKRRPFSFLPLHTPRGENGGSGAATPAGEIHEKGNKRPKVPRAGSWDLLGDRADWEEYNLAQASVENLRFAQGDAGTNKLSRLYYWALNRGIVVRWILYILPILGLLWIPGIIGLTAAPEGNIWGVKLLYWSIWLSVFWGGFWAATAIFMILPSIWHNTLGAIIPSAKSYTDVVRNLGRYAKLIIWSAGMWISFTPIIINHYIGDDTSVSRSNLSVIVNLLFGLFLSSVIYGIEKLIIQIIAFQFHRDSYEDRLKDQKFQLKCLTTLYINSHDIPGRSDTLVDAQSSKTKGSQIPRLALRKAMKGLREVAATTTTALGNVASEMAGQSVLQTNSPLNRVTAALTSANKSKALARRLYYSFRAPGADHISIEDIAKFFPDLETAVAAFETLDKDGNGDATRDEIEAAVMTLHRERLSLEASMRDLDGAVRRLDDIFMVIVFAIVILVMAAMVTTKLTTLVTSAGTFILGLSWLIGSTMQEILLACIFLFVKHPFDVGDRVDIDGNAYTVAKMQLMSTNFKRTDGKFVWIGNNILATKVIENIRRSGPTSETFVFEVAFDTSFDTLQLLRGRMLAFVKDNARDFLPIFDVVVDDIPAQGKMVLKADIKYKSNWQQGALKVQRRNKWICALKMTLSDLKIWGPAGAGDPAPPPPDPVKYTMVPYEDVLAAAQAASPPTPPPTFQSATAVAHNASKLTDSRQAINDPAQDIFNEQEELEQDTGLSTAAPSRVGTPGLDISASSMRQRVGHAPRPGETIEMTSAPVNRR